MSRLVKPKFLVAVHPTQMRILELVAGTGVDEMTLREIGELIGVGATPQKVKHHLIQLVRYGFLDIVAGKYRIGRALKYAVR